ncbi:MAG: DUF2207 family protein, partial [Acidimicrobiales bacterium]
FELVNPRCDRGRSSAVGGCEVAQVAHGHLFVRTSGLSDHEAVTVSATVGAALQDAPPAPAVPSGPADDPGTGLVVPAVWAGIGAIVGAIAVWWTLRVLGRETVWAGGAVSAAFGPDEQGPDEEEGDVPVVRLDHDHLAKLATIEFEAPRGISAAEGGVIYDERVRPQHRVAWLIEAESRDEIVLNVDSNRSYIERGTADAAPDVEVILRAMFSGRPTISLGAYDSSFTVGWSMLERKLEGWRVASGLWDPRGRSRRHSARIAGAIAALVGLGMAAAGGAVANRGAVGFVVLAALGGLVAGAGVGAVIKAWELPMRTAAGSGIWILIESFRRFIADSEARHAEAAAKMGRLRQYTAWAVALGELDHWERAVNAAAAVPGSSVGEFQPGRYSGTSFSQLSSATIIAATPPSQSGRGFGGGGGGFGGGAGGGGGGGGGGSW